MRHKEFITNSGIWQREIGTSWQKQTLSSWDGISSCLVTSHEASEERTSHFSYTHFPPSPIAWFPCVPPCHKRCKGGKEDAPKEMQHLGQCRDVIIIVLCNDRPYNPVYQSICGDLHSLNMKILSFYLERAPLFPSTAMFCHLSVTVPEMSEMSMSVGNNLFWRISWLGRFIVEKNIMLGMVSMKTWQIDR